METRSYRINGLDGLRALAVITVFLNHKVPFFNHIEIGSAGVTLFFVLSGFLITSILLRDRREIDCGNTTAWAAITHFFKSRAFRIFPAYFMMIFTVTLLTKLGWHLVTYEDVPCYTTFTTNFCVSAWQAWPPLGHFWSLAIEEQFYILSAPLFLLVPARHARMIVAGLLSVAVATFLLETAAGATRITVGVDSLINFGMLALGSGLALAARTREGTASGWLVVGLALLVFVKVAPWLFGASEIATNVLLQALGPFAAIAIWATVTNQRSWAVTMLHWAPLRQLGRVSYAFYLWHLSVDFSSARPALERLLSSSTSALAVQCLAEFSATVAIAIVSWKVLEAPMLRLRDAAIKVAIPVPQLEMPDFSRPIGTVADKLRTYPVSAA